jgi:hypothetical protein
MVIQEGSALADLVIKSLPHSAVHLVELFPSKAKARAIFR